MFFLILSKECRMHRTVYRRLVSVVFAVLLCCLLAGVATAQQAKYSWQKQHAKVIPTGDIEWAPQPFEFKADGTVKYIDYQNGDDNNPGTKDKPWKHHPWDSAAGGQAKSGQADTYVFKRGVIYRGSLMTKGSGTPEQPIRLTSDPNWGTGEAVLCGSEVPTGWKQGADNKDIPDAGKVWYVDLDYNPRCVWLVRGDEITRINLARTPNWTVSNPDDPMSEWWEWENPGWWDWFRVKTKGKNFIQVGKKSLYLGVDKKHLTGSAEDYVGGYAWTEWGVVMGMPYPMKIQKYLPDRKAVAFDSPFYKMAVIATGDRYYLEDRPNFLDVPGEFWFDKKGKNGGRLYIRLPNDQDPNQAQVEVAKHLNLIDSLGIKHLDISGLTLRFTNNTWELQQYIWRNHDVLPAAIRILGPLEDVTVRNCKIVHNVGGIRFDQLGPNNLQDGMYIQDNEIRYTDHPALRVVGSGNKKANTSTMRDLQFLRNRLHEIGLRSAYTNHNHAVWIEYLVDGEFAGNVLTRTYGAGIFISPVKSSGQGGDAPYARVLVHHNKVVDPMLTSCDWGGIEVNQGGPAYVYNNVSDNPGPGSFAHAYYFDGGFKRYMFNCIAWGKRNDKETKLHNLTAVQQLVGFGNSVFNNSFYRFVKCVRNQTPEVGRQKFLGNIFDDISEMVFRVAQPAKKDKAQNARDLALDDTGEYPLYTNAYANNVFYNITGDMGCYTAAGEISKTLEEFRSVLEANHTMASSVGTMADKSPFVNADKHDFTPVPNSPAKDKGVKFFVPWSLYAMVGEWNFTRNQKDATNIIDEHWYMTPQYGERWSYFKMPRYPLTGQNISADDYVLGDLEDWTSGALTLNGKDQFCKLANAEMTGNYSAEVKMKKNVTTVSVPAAERKSPDIRERNVLVEVYCKTADGHTDGGLVSHLDGAGYELAVGSDGGLVWTVNQSASKGGVLRAGAKINDGKWHHIIAEADRKSGRMTIYVDGKTVAESTEGGIVGGSLSNPSDLLVGKSAAGGMFAGAIDFVRIAQGTLEDAETDIEELYAWQFDGPQFRDFNGDAPVGKRDAGAIEGK
jgi:hypothetical protein